MRDIPNNMGTGQDFEMMTKNMVRPNDSDIYVHLCISGKERGAESARLYKKEFQGCASSTLPCVTDSDCEL